RLPGPQALDLPACAQRGESVIIAAGDREHSALDDFVARVRDEAHRTIALADDQKGVRPLHAARLEDLVVELGHIRGDRADRDAGVNDCARKHSRTERRRLAVEAVEDQRELLLVTTADEGSAAQVSRIGAPRQAATVVNARGPTVVVTLEELPFGGGDPGHGGTDRVPVRMIGRRKEDQEPRSLLDVSSVALRRNRRERSYRLECQGLSRPAASFAPSSLEKSSASRKRSGLRPHRSATATPEARSGAISTAERCACLRSSQPAIPREGVSASAAVRVVISRREAERVTNAAAPPRSGTTRLPPSPSPSFRLLANDRSKRPTWNTNLTLCPWPRGWNRQPHNLTARSPMWAGQSGTRGSLPGRFSLDGSDKRQLV